MQITDKGGNMDLSKQHTKWEKPGMREHILCDSIHINLRKKPIQSMTTAWDLRLPRMRAGERAGWRVQEGAVRRWQDSILTQVVVTRVHTCVKTRWHGHPLYMLPFSKVYWNTQKANKQRKKLSDWHEVAKAGSGGGDMAIPGGSESSLGAGPGCGSGKPLGREQMVWVIVILKWRWEPQAEGKVSLS